MINNPKVTVLMPVYNSEKYLQKAIDSILNQTFTDFEFLIINDASTDNTAKIIKSYKDLRIKIITNKKNIGITKSLNLGLKISKGKYLARMDADDICLPNRLIKQVTFLDKNIACLLVAARVKTIGRKSDRYSQGLNDSRYLDYESIKNQLPERNCLAHSSIMARAPLVKKYQYDENLNSCQDYELWLRLCADNYRIEKINEILLYRRMKPFLFSNRDIKRISESKTIKAKLTFFLKRIKELKIGVFELKVAFYLFKDLVLYLRLI